MLVLHGSWVCAQGAHPARFVLWGETAPAGRPRARRRSNTAAARPHPFAATGDELRVALVDQGVPLAEGLEPAEMLAQLPSAEGLPLPSPDLGDGRTAPAGEGLALTTWRVPALSYPAAQVAELLPALSNDESQPPDLLLGDDTRFWVGAGRFALELISRQRVWPAWENVDGTYRAGWQPLLDEDRDAERFRALAWEAAGTEPRPGDLLTDFLRAVVDAIARPAVAPIFAPGPARSKPPGRTPRPRPVAAAWLEALAGDPIVQAPEAELAVFDQQYRAWAEPPQDTAGSADSFRVCFRLVPPLAEPDDGQQRTPRPPAQDWLVEYLLQATDDPSLIVPAADVWRQRGTTARFLNRRFDNPQERLLAGLGRAARLVPPL